MTREDTERLFELLAIYRPNDPHLKDRALRAVWTLTLRPYAVDDVREAVASYFREQKYWPDPTDIAKRCPKPEVKTEIPREPDWEAVENLKKLHRELKEGGWLD